MDWWVWHIMWNGSLLATTGTTAASQACPWCGPCGQPQPPLSTLCTLVQACDQLISLEMIDYRGRLVKAYRWHDSNLLRAACGGGGGNFGEEALGLHAVAKV